MATPPPEWSLSMTSLWSPFTTDSMCSAFCLLVMMMETMDCMTSWQPCSGSRTTSVSSAVTRMTSQCSGSQRGQPVSASCLSVAGRQFDQLVRAAKCDPWIYFPLARKWFYESIMRCLRSLDLDTLGVATLEYMGSSDQHPAVLEGEVKSLATVFLPVVDGDIVPKDPRLLMSDKKYLASNGVLDRKYVLGYTNAEGLGGMDGFVHKADAAALAQLDTVDNARRHMQAMADAHFPFSGVPKSAMSLLEYQYTYPRKDGRVRDFMGLLNVNKDVFYALPTLEMVNALTSASPTTDVFVYLFDQ